MGCPHSSCDFFSFAAGLGRHVWRLARTQRAREAHVDVFESVRVFTPSSWLSATRRGPTCAWNLTGYARSTRIIFHLPSIDQLLQLRTFKKEANHTAENLSETFSIFKCTADLNIQLDRIASRSNKCKAMRSLLFLVYTQ